MNTDTVQISSINTDTLNQTGKLTFQFRVTQDDLRFSGSAVIPEADLADYRFGEMGKVVGEFLQKKIAASATTEVTPESTPEAPAEQ